MCLKNKEKEKNFRVKLGILRGMYQPNKIKAEDSEEVEQELENSMRIIHKSEVYGTFVIRELEMEYIIRKPFVQKLFDSLFGNK